MPYPVPGLDRRYQAAAELGGMLGEQCAIQMVTALAIYDVIYDTIPPWISIQWYFERYYRSEKDVWLDGLEDRWDDLMGLGLPYV